MFVLLNFVTSMYALGAFITKVCKSPGLDAAFVCWPYPTVLAAYWTLRSVSNQQSWSTEELLYVMKRSCDP